MRYTCGIIFYRDGQILVGHTTGQEHWDLPKGKTEGSESFKDAAVRECYEETGFEIDERDLLFLGEVAYRKGKRLVLFFYTAKYKPEAEKLKCISTYTNRYGQIRPELDKFKYIDIEDCELYLTERMCNSIIKAITQFEKKKPKKGKIMEVKIYGRKSGCKWCDTAKEICEENKIPMEFVDLEAEGIDGAALSEICGKPVRTVPQIFIDGEYVGGCTEFVAELQKRQG